MLKSTAALAKLFSEAIYEFRVCRKELEDGASRLERLGRIGVMVNKMRARQAALDFGGGSGDGEDSEKTEVSE
jgi:hypothetical protein